MNTQLQIRSMIFIVFLALLPVCADQCMTPKRMQEDRASALLPVCADQCLADRLAISIGKSDGRTTFFFRGKKQQEFAAVEEHLKKFAAIDENMRVTFIVHDDVTVKEVVELIYKVHAIGFTKITIETCFDDSPDIEDWVFREVRVLPVVDCETTEP
ncbi:MAG: hypothetical protein ACOX5G_05430 [Kiritimatiellia bacterium]|jgi:biopolymer transport protein ExbD